MKKQFGVVMMGAQLLLHLPDKIMKTHTHSVLRGVFYFERVDWTIHLTHSCLLPALGVTGVNWSQSQLSLLSLGEGGVTPLDSLTHFTANC